MGRVSPWIDTSSSPEKGICKEKKNIEPGKNVLGTTSCIKRSLINI
jgi:hypothetical protein